MLQSLVDDVEIIITINANDIEITRSAATSASRMTRLPAPHGHLPRHGLSRRRRRHHALRQPACRRPVPPPSGIARHHVPSALPHLREYPTTSTTSSAMKGTAKTNVSGRRSRWAVVTAPGPGSGKMATCLSQLYHDHKRGIDAGYAKYQRLSPYGTCRSTIPSISPSEAATVDLDDSNIIKDPFHLEAYGVSTVNYNRDVEIFPVLKAMMERIARIEAISPPPIWASTCRTRHHRRRSRPRS